MSTPRGNTSAFRRAAPPRAQPGQFGRREFMRRGGLIGGLALGGGVLLAACGDGDEPGAGGGSEELDPNSPEDVSSVRSSAVSWLWAPVDVAVERGYFEQEGLTNTDQATGRGENAPVVLGGGADMLLGIPTSPMKASIQGQSLKIIGKFLKTYASNVVMTDPAWTEAGLTEDSTAEERAAAMAGYRWGTTGAGAAPDLLLRYLMAQLGGVEPDEEAELIPIQGGAPALLGAVENGNVDGFCLSSPTSDQGVQNFGMHYLFDMTQDPVDDLVGFPYIIYAANADYIDEFPERVTAYSRALQRALNFIHAEEKGFKDLMRPIFGDGLEDDVYDLAFQKNYPVYPTDLVMDEGNFQQAMDFLNLSLEVQGVALAEGAVDNFGYDDAVAASFAEEAREAVGDEYE